MARSVARPRSSKSTSRSDNRGDHVRGGRRRIASLVSVSRTQKFPILGVAAVLAAAALTNWLTSQVDILTSFREQFVQAIGVGAFLVAGLLILVALWLLAGARWPGLTVLRKMSGGLVLTIFGLGIAGMFSPHWTVGGVGLETVTAGGDLGDFLTSPLGALVMTGLFVSGWALMAPRASAAASRLSARALAAAARHGRRQALSLSLRLPYREDRSDPWSLEGVPYSAPLPPAVMTDVPAAASAPEGGIENENDDKSSPLTDPAGGGQGEGEGEADVVEDTASGAKRSERKRRHSEDGWQLPALSLLNVDPPLGSRQDGQRQARIIVETLASFGVEATVTQINQGPAVTQFGIEPGWDVKTRAVAVRDEKGRTTLDDLGQLRMRDVEISRTRVRVNKITRLTNDLALALAAPSIRVEAPVPGQPMIGIEVPNEKRRVVSLRGVIDSAEFKRAAAKGGLPIALGRNVTGKPVIVDLTQMPHVLIAGATGSGKSVCINSIIACLLMHYSPEAVRLVMVDPKRVELTGYGDIPHLAFSRVVTDPDEVVGVLGVVVTEMERRYRRFEHVGARNIVAYNASDRPEGKLPYWVVIIDELADLMMSAPVDVERQLVRLAQLARATGIHLVVATQRPSVDVVTGLIKANFPTRIAFATTSQTDARVIMDRAGAEKLLGRGDMLFRSTDSITAQRVQGTFVSDEEIAGLIAFWTQDRFQDVPRPTLDHLLDDATHQRSDVAIVTAAATDRADAAAAGDEEVEPSAQESAYDTLFPEARTLAADHTRISASMLQRRLRIGHPRAARLIDQLEQAGVVGAAEGSQSRLVVMTEAPTEAS